MHQESYYNIIFDLLYTRLTTQTFAISAIIFDLLYTRLTTQTFAISAIVFYLLYTRLTTQTFAISAIIFENGKLYRRSTGIVAGGLVSIYEWLIKIKM